MWTTIDYAAISNALFYSQIISPQRMVFTTERDLELTGSLTCSPSQPGCDSTGKERHIKVELIIHYNFLC